MANWWVGEWVGGWVCGLVGRLVGWWVVWLSWWVGGCMVWWSVQKIISQSSVSSINTPTNPPTAAEPARLCVSHARVATLCEAQHGHELLHVGGLALGRHGLRQPQGRRHRQRLGEEGTGGRGGPGSAYNSQGKTNSPSAKGKRAQAPRRVPGGEGQHGRRPMLASTRTG